MTMDRRGFIATTGVAAATTVLPASTADAQDDSPRDYYEFRSYAIADGAQRDAVDGFLEHAVPAMNRIGIEPVGVFSEADNGDARHILMRHTSIASFGDATAKLLADGELMAKAGSFMAGPGTETHVQYSTELMVAFAGMPVIKRPVTNADRVFELRIYKSPSVATGQKKIEMFNSGEIDIMRRAGMGPVFYGEQLTGPAMPNLTYMLSFESMEAQKTGWRAFIDDPEWKRMSAMPEYANEKILSGIDKLFLKPTAHSQL
jgi:hypothetical protein